MTGFSISCAKIVTTGGILENGFINVSEGMVKSLSLNPIYETIDEFRLQTAVPGFIDIHTHGYFGVDAMESSEAEIHRWARLIAMTGVTSFIPTCVSAPTEDLISFVDKISRAAVNQHNGEARIIGARSEGPYISMEKKGAHNPAFVRKVNFSEIEQIIDSCSGTLKIIDMAPELADFGSASAMLQRAGIIVSAGHSSADFKTTSVALSSGIRTMTHFYNAMTQFDHRTPGMVGAGLLSPDAFLEIIADFHHVSAEAIRVMVQMKGWNKVIAITDSLSVGGTEQKASVLGGLKTEVHDGVAWISGTNTIAGSVLTLDQAFRNLHTLGAGLTDLAKAFSSNPATLLGLNDRGDIAPGKRADINFLDPSMNITGTMIAGVVMPAE